MSSAVSMWPEDLFVDEIQTPISILEEQAQALAAESGRRIVAELPQRTADDVTNIDFEIVAPSIKRRFRIFSIRNAVDRPYPVEILPPDQGIAKGLKTEVIIEPSRRPTSESDIGAELFGRPPKYGPNPWLVGTQAEFIAKLREVLDHPATRGVITSLLALISQQSFETIIAQFPFAICSKFRAHRITWAMTLNLKTSPSNVRQKQGSLNGRPSPPECSLA